MSALLRLAAAIDALNGAIARGVIWLVLGCVLLSAGTATLRYLFDWGSNGLLEAQWFMFGLIFLLCAPWALRENAHVRIDVISGRFSVRTRAVIDILGGLLFLLPICALVAWDAWEYSLIAYGQNETSPNPGGLPWWPMKLAIPVAFVLLALQGIAEIIKSLALLTGRRAAPPATASH